MIVVSISIKSSGTSHPNKPDQRSIVHADRTTHRLRAVPEFKDTNWCAPTGLGPDRFPSLYLGVNDDGEYVAKYLTFGHDGGEVTGTPLLLGKDFIINSQKVVFTTKNWNPLSLQFIRKNTNLAKSYNNSYNAIVLRGTATGKDPQVAKGSNLIFFLSGEYCNCGKYFKC